MLITALIAGVIVSLTPGKGAASGVVSGVARAVQRLVSASRNGQEFAGAPPVGALFTTSQGRLGRHFCTASVVDSPAGDLVITAAHCVTGTSGRLAFVPGYDHGATPYGVWAVTSVYVDSSWSSSADPDDDVAFLRVSQPGSAVPVEAVTGAETLAAGTPARQLVELVGYPDASGRAIACRNWTSQPGPGRLEFDCGGFTNGTSGAPFLASVSPVTGQGTVIGVIGGYDQGGYSPQVSYSSVFGPDVAALYRQATASR